MQKIIIGLLTVLAVSSFGQEATKPKSLVKNQYGLNSSWFEGTCMLNDGTELKGVLRYNDKTGVLGYENGVESRSFTAKNVVGFEFFDEQLQQQRIFYSLPYEGRDGIERIYFFEQLFDFDDFAVMSQLDRLEIDERNKFNGGSAMTSIGPPLLTKVYTVLEFSQTETIFFMSKDGKLEPYLNIVEKETDELFFDQHRTKNKFIDKGLFKKYAGSKWSEVAKYADAENLQFERRSDLMAMLNYLKFIR